MNVIRLLSRFASRSKPERSSGDCRVPAQLTRRMDALRQMIRRGGPESRLAYAELHGMLNVIMWMGR
jgi:hypothetical protein